MKLSFDMKIHSSKIRLIPMFISSEHLSTNNSKDQQCEDREKLTAKT